MEKQLKCPKCGTVQPRHRYCIKCKLDFQAYAAHLRKKREAAQAAQSAGQPAPKADQAAPRPPKPTQPTGGSPLGKNGAGVQAKSIVCPKCRMKQPLRPKCAKCGFDIKAYVLQKQQGGNPDINIEKPIAPAEPPKSEWGASKPLRPDQFAHGENPFDSTGRYWTPPSSDTPQEEEHSGDERPPDPWAASGAGLREIGKLFSDTWALYVNRLGVLMGVYISTVVASIAPMFLAGIVMAVAVPASPDFGIFIGIGFAAFAALLFFYVLSWGFSALYFAVTDSSLGFKDAWSYGKTRIWSMFWLMLLLGYLVQGLFFLLIIPAIIFMVLSSLAIFSLIDEGARGMDAVLRSRNYIKGYGWPVFGRLALLWVISMAVGLIPFLGMILSLFFTPFAIAYTYLIYRDLQAVKQSLPGYTPTRGEKAKWLISATLGLLIAVAMVIAAGIYAYKTYGPEFLGIIQNMERGQMDMQELERMMQEGGAPGGYDSGAYSGGDAKRPYEYERILGSWSGTDAQGNDFTFYFMDGYFASITSNSLGLRADADMIVDSDIGYDASIDSVRVPPGASLMDFRITSSSMASDVGKTAAGVYSLSFDREMKLCIGQPGSGVRPTEYVASNRVMCFNLTRGASAAPTITPPSADKPRGRLVHTQKDVYAPNEEITIEYSGMPGNQQDWITLVSASASTETYGQWFYTQGQRKGMHTFSGVQAGDYEIRAYFDWPAGGYSVKDRHHFRVGSSSSSGATAGAGVQPSLTLNKSSFQPGETINVTFTAPSTYKQNAWIGIIPSHVSHGSEAENDSYDLTYQYLSGQTTGILIFTAPSGPGTYDMRMHDTDDNGREVASATFTVGGGTYGGASSGGSSGGGRPSSTQATTDASAFIYSWNYKGEVRLNGKVIQALEGEPNVQYSYNTFADLRRGSNTVEIIHNKVPGQQNYSIEIRFTPMDSNQKYGSFETSGTEGTKTYTFNYP